MAWVVDTVIVVILLGAVVAGLAADRDLPLCAFPIWFWHWADPSALPARRYRRLAARAPHRDGARTGLAAGA